MSRSLRGEMTEQAVPQFSHPPATTAAVAAAATSSSSPTATSIAGLAPAEAAFTALGYAVRAGDLRAVMELLDGDEVGHQLLKRCDYAGNTAVHLASVGPNPDVMRELLVRGASVHVRNAANNSPLFLADKMGNEACVALLKEAGAHLWKDTPVDDKRAGRGAIIS
jgi:lysophospholipase